MRQMEDVFVFVFTYVLTFLSAIETIQRPEARGRAGPKKQ